MSRLSVPKTYKLYVGGTFPRSESGRTTSVRDANGGFLANAARGSRKDVRDAVVAARKGAGAWSRATPYNRGQVIYRVAEMLEGRRDQFVDLLHSGTGTEPDRARAEVDAATDRLVHYAGWTDKLAAVLGSTNPVSSPYFSYTAPEPTGVVGVLSPAGKSLLGLVSVLAPVLAGGNAAVVLVPAADTCVAITFAEVLATSDVPAGVVNVLTGSLAEMGPPLASHGDVDALDLTGADPDLRVSLEQAAAQTLKRVYVPRAEPDFTADPGLGRLRAFVEFKTVWHAVGALSLTGGSAY